MTTAFAVLLLRKLIAIATLWPDPANFYGVFIINHVFGVVNFVWFANLACQKQNDVYDKTLFSNMAQMSKYTSFVMLIFIAISVLVINDKSV